MSIQPDLAGVAFAAHLASFGDRPAVHLGSDTVSYAQLAWRVQEMAASFGSARRLVALEADNTLSSLTVYLAALSSGHPLLILPPAEALPLSRCWRLTSRISLRAPSTVEQPLKNAAPGASTISIPNSPCC